MAPWVPATNSPLARLSSWHRPHELDIVAMKSAAAAMIGEHDFSAFRASGCGARTTTRCVSEITIATLDGLHISWNVAADGELLQSGTVKMPVIAPGKTKTITVPFTMPHSRAAGTEYWLNVDFTLAADAAWAVVK